MKNIKNDYCIRLFTDSDDRFRPQFGEVHLENGNLYASNLYMVAKISADLCVKKYKPVEKFPSIESLFKKHETTDKNIVSVATLFDDLMKFECCFKLKLIDCQECDGEGKCTCEHCDSEYECKNCIGTGTAKGKEIVFSSHEDCILFDRKYNPRFIELIIRTAVFTGVDKIEILNGIPPTGTIFIVGDFTILLMTKM